MIPDADRRDEGDELVVDGPATFPVDRRDFIKLTSTGLDVVMGDTDLCPWDGGTYGSLSIRQFGPVLRQAAAEARAVLLQLASDRLQVPSERLAVKAGTISDTAGVRLYRMPMTPARIKEALART